MSDIPKVALPLAAVCEAVSDIDQLIERLLNHKYLFARLMQYHRDSEYERWSITIKDCGSYFDISYKNFSGFSDWKQVLLRKSDSIDLDKFLKEIE